MRLTGDMDAFVAPSFSRVKHFNASQELCARTRRTGVLRRSEVVAQVDLTRSSSTGIPALRTVLTRLPQPVVMARQQLDQDFAVLLMRSGYAAVDELDFVPMQQFQAVFFDIRSREWEQFIKRNYGMRQGIIADPRYFDFISYAQMLTIQTFMREPQVVFEEAYGDTDGAFKTRVVRRDLDRYPTPESLLQAWRKQVGEKIYERLMETVRRPVAVPGADVGTLMQGIKEIYDYFMVSGFCLDIRLKRMVEKNGREGYEVEMVGPCVLWGCDALRRLKSIPNDYDCLCVEAFSEKCGAEVECRTRFTENSILREWRTRQGFGRT